MRKRSTKAKPYTPPMHYTARELIEHELADQIADRDAAIRDSDGHPGGTLTRYALECEQRCIVLRVKLAHEIANTLGHVVSKCGISYECYRCSLSGTFDASPIGPIFVEKCLASS